MNRNEAISFNQEMNRAMKADAIHDQLSPLAKAIDKIHRELAPVKPESEGYLADGSYEFVVAMGGQRFRGVLGLDGQIIEEGVI